MASNVCLDDTIVRSFKASVIRPTPNLLTLMSHSCETFSPAFPPRSERKWHIKLMNPSTMRHLLFCGWMGRRYFPEFTIWPDCGRRDVRDHAMWRHGLLVPTFLFYLRRQSMALTGTSHLRRRYTIRFARTEPADYPVHGSIVMCDMSLECPGHVENRVIRNYTSFYFQADSAARAVRLPNQSAADT